MTARRKTRRLEYDDRVAIQQADQAIRKDVIRAVVELTTNCNDSYHRLEDAGLPASGVIIIEVQRRHTNSVLRIHDCAEGMDGDMMDRKVGTYGAATSGFKEGRSVRGLWGRGLKDAIYGLGHGSLVSVCGDFFNRCALTIRGGTPFYEQEKTIRASKVRRKQFGIPPGANGTIVEIVVSRTDVRFPQFDNLRRALAAHFELRAIMSNPKRRVLLRELDGHGKVKQELQLSYKAPSGVQVFDETFEIQGFPAQARLEIYRSDVALSSPADEGDFADGGVLLISKHVVMALTLFKFEHNEYASHLYGRLTCDYLHDLLIKDEPVLTATRDGINWRHEFTKKLKTMAEEKLEPLVEEERRRAQAGDSGAISKRLRERLVSALKELNSIASSELGKIDGDADDNGDGKRPFMPPSGFGFVPEYVYIQTGKAAGLTLRTAIPEKAVPGSLITIESDNPEVRILTPQVAIEALLDYAEIGQARVEVEGGQVGTEAVVTARLDGLKAEAMVKVISKREPPTHRDPNKRRGGLIREVRFDPAAEPKQRVRFDRATSTIIVATKAPCVAAYLDETGKGHEDPQGQVLLAEMITEAVCREIARRGVESGNYLSFSGSETDAVQREYIRLQNQYGHRIHTCFVDARYRRDGYASLGRKGRPPRDETLSRAVIEV